jgi:hypothetical protein
MLTLFSFMKEIVTERERERERERQRGEPQTQRRERRKEGKQHSKEPESCLVSGVA